MSGKATHPVHAEIDALQALSAPELRTHWATVFGRPAPRRVSRVVLIRAIAWELQAQVYGGLKPSVRRRLQTLAGPTTLRQVGQRRVQALTPGTRLLREWKGQTHTVEILPDGYAWQGARYRSLSVIARTITGTSYSGPKFFGLLAKKDT
ncbi:MAG: DUF2924 domain-containing protein [Gammaproteobacteria bacterium]